MVTADIDDILREVDPDSLKMALQEKRTGCLRMLAAAAVDYELELVNPEYSPDDAGRQRRAASLELAAAAIRRWKWAVGEIDARLSGSAGALHGAPATED